MQEARILLVDDEEDIIEFLKYNLEKEGYKVASATDGKQAIKKALNFDPHLIILDVMMPEMDGIEVCEQLRSNDEFQDTIIAFLTARGESYTHISALESGGDDFITKPMKPKVFAARIKALLRRHKSLNSGKLNEHIKTFGDLVIDFERFVVIKKGIEITLAKKEFELLALLTTKPGKVYKREKIMKKVWGQSVIVGDRTIDVHIRKLREKLGQDVISTLKGVGYKFEL
jgi:two-component system alkaline phosphatase synthesis response regulator PhoP